MLRERFYGLLALLYSGHLFAQTEIDGVIVESGNDVTAELSTLTTIIKTAQSILLYGIGPLVGTAMVIRGFKLVGTAERGEKGPGVIMVVCGCACFIVGPLVKQFIDATK